MIGSNWFENLFGFVESRSISVKNQFSINNPHPISIDSLIIDKPEEIVLKSNLNGISYPVGLFITPSVKELRNIVCGDFLSRFNEDKLKSSKFSIEHIVVNDIRSIHSFKPGSLIQAASQFNCLEFPNFDKTPEDGITNYIFDNTQGPACAMACAAGTLYRNYFTPVCYDEINTQIGQSQQNQVINYINNDIIIIIIIIINSLSSKINNLIDIENLLDNKSNKFWEVKNGYIFSTQESLSAFKSLLDKNKDLKESLVENIKIGLHLNVGVTDVLNKDTR
jgi:hypothetical protein